MTPPPIYETRGKNSAPHPSKKNNLQSLTGAQFDHVFVSGGVHCGHDYFIDLLWIFDF